MIAYFHLLFITIYKFILLRSISCKPNSSKQKWNQKWDFKKTQKQFLFWQEFSIARTSCFAFKLHTKLASFSSLNQSCTSTTSTTISTWTTTTKMIQDDKLKKLRNSFRKEKQIEIRKMVKHSKTNRNDKRCSSWDLFHSPECCCSNAIYVNVNQVDVLMSLLIQIQSYKCII